jgi:hypothetical protein
VIVQCADCLVYFDDAYRWTICPHETFAANDGANNFRHHEESYLSSEPPRNPETMQRSTLKSSGREVDEESFKKTSDFCDEPPTCWMCGKACLSYPCSACGAPKREEDPREDGDPPEHPRL